MKTIINYFCRVMCAFLLCVGMVLTSCEETNPLDDNKTEQSGNENNGNETPEPEPLVTASVQNITFKDVEVTGKLNVSASDLPFCQVVVYYSNEESFNVNAAEKVSVTTFDNDQKFTVTLSDLNYNTKYNYCVYAKSKYDEIYTEIADFTTSQHPYLMQADINMSSAIDLSSSASANCYIISEAGLYKFKAVKGNSAISVSGASSAAILWETFGTDTAPNAAEIVAGVCCKDGYIAFQTADTFKEGNAVIAAKDASDNILWSWHIWFTDQPQAQVYNNNAGTMMDRNLGATSATPGDVGALGLLYQWGRKDPFLGSSSISSNTIAKSTIAWPSAVSSDSSNGTIVYATANPTTFIGYNSNCDWLYTGSSSTDNTRWTTSESSKSIYDPCPSGWRVPDGGDNGIWSKAGFDDTTYDGTNQGISFSITSPSKTWYPASGCRYFDDGSLHHVGNYGYYWSASPSRYDRRSAYSLDFDYDGLVTPSDFYFRAFGRSVRCIKE